MTRSWRAALIGLALVGLAGLVLTWRWQTLGAQSALAQAGWSLVLVPIGAMVLWGMKRLARGPADGNGGRTHDEGSPRSARAPRTDAAAPQQDVVCNGLAVLDGAVCLSAGNGASQVLGAVAHRAVWPQLDDALRDVEGNPVYTARVPALMVPGPLDEGAGTPTRVLRARGILEKVWHPLRLRLQQALRSALPAEAGGTRLQTGPALRLKVVVILPSDWTEHQRGETLAALRHRSADMLDATAGQVQASWELLPAGQGVEPEDLWGWVDGQMQQWSRSGEAASMVLLAADSGLDDEAIEQRQARGELFTAIHQQGRIPGEGAAALWLGTRAWVEAVRPQRPALVCLHRPIVARRDRSADAPGHVEHEALQAGLGKALSRLDPGLPLLTVVSDADHRASRTTELMHSLAAVAPGLEAAAAVCRLGDACGDLGVVGPLAPVAVAAGALEERLARTGTGPRTALAICVQSPLQRVVLPLGAWSTEVLAA